MRSIAALTLPDVVPSPLDPISPEFLDVDPTSLLVDETYQRELSQRSIALIRRIVGEWSWRAFKPPVVVRVEGGLHVIDGQHTAIAAATHPDIATIPVMLVDAGETAARADAFVRHNRDRIAVTPTALHHAMVAAGDEDAVTVDQVCRRAGVLILRQPPATGRFKVGETLAVGTVKTLVSRRHAIGARRVLEICTKARLAPVSATAMKAVEWLLFKPEYKGEISEDDIVSTLMAAGDLETESRRFAAERSLPEWRGLASVIFMKRRKRRGS